MLGGLPKPGPLILGPEKPGPYPTVPVRLPAEGTVRAKGERRRTPPPGRWPGRAQDPASPAGNQAGPGRLGPYGCHLSPVRPVWEFAMMSPWERGKPASSPPLLSSLTPPLQQALTPTHCPP